MGLLAKLVAKPTVDGFALPKEQSGAGNKVA
jgi:hypothetical protein